MDPLVHLFLCLYACLLACSFVYRFLLHCCFFEQSAQVQLAKRELVEAEVARNNALESLRLSETRVAEADSESQRFSEKIVELEATILRLQQELLRLEAEKRCETERSRAQEELVSRYVLSRLDGLAAGAVTDAVFFCCAVLSPFVCHY